MLEALLHAIETSNSWIVECTILYLVPFVHEDVAILLGSLLVVEHRLPVPLALITLYGGILSSDLFLYGLGALAQRSAWGRRLLLRPRIERLGSWLENHVSGMVVVARFVPGLMFPVYIGCGLYRVSFLRFALTTAITAAIYLPIIFYAVASFGEAVLSDLGYWTWLVALAIVAVATVNWVQGPNWQLILRVSTSGVRALLRRVFIFDDGRRVSHRGMPALGAMPTKVSLAERIPPWLFYIPLGAQWLWLALRFRSLSLPALANPKIEVGGLWGESKSAYLDMVGGAQRAWIADFVTLRCTGRAEADVASAETAIAERGLDFPLVVKPDIGWRGFGVRLVADAAGLNRYLAAFPKGETVIMQRPITHDGEAGVLYARLPGEPDGKVLSLTLRYFPYVTGDGATPVRDLILRDQRSSWKAGFHFGLDGTHLGAESDYLQRVPAAGETVRLSFVGSNRVGGLYRDGREHITDALSRRFDAISKSLPEFYYGRYDIKFESIEQLRAGEGFSIIEINGAGGESINVWDPLMPLGQVYRELFAQQRLLFEIGARNRASGYTPTGLWAILRSQWHQHRLIVHYPPSG